MYKQTYTQAIALETILFYQALLLRYIIIQTSSSSLSFDRPGRSYRQAPRRAGPPWF